MTTAHNLRLQVKLSEAFLGHAKMDITVPPEQMEYKWGKYNLRPIENRAVKKLVNSFREEGVLRWAHHICVGVRPAWVVKDSLTASSEVPFTSLETVQWTDAARGQVVEIYSGAHRAKALKMYAEALEKELASAEKASTSKAAGKEKDTDDKSSKKAAAEAAIAEKKKVLAFGGLWVVKFYNLSA